MVGLGMQPYGIRSMLKKGHKHLSGVNEAILKNIDACKQLSQITHTSLGPNVQNSKYNGFFYCVQTSGKNIFYKVALKTLKSVEALEKFLMKHKKDYIDIHRTTE